MPDTNDPDTNSVGSFGVQKSDFTQQTTKFAGTATIDVVVNGQNIKQTLDDFFQFATLAVLQPVGGAGVTPILEIAGADNNIRGISDGSGILSTISGFNDVEIKHNFQRGSGGAAVLTDITAASPVIGDIIAGQGISTAVVAGGVQVAISGAPVATKTVIVNTISDFPAAVAGVITLAANTDYFLTNDITTGDRFDVSAGDIVVRGSDSSVISFIYTGTGDMFTGVDATFRTGRITIVAATGRCFNWLDSTGTKLFQFIDGTIGSCDKIGILGGTNAGAIQINNVALFGIVTDGIEFTGSIDAFLALTNISNISAGSVYNLNAATFNTFTVDDNIATLAAGTFFISGLTGSANILSGGLGTVLNSRTSGAGTPLSNISPDDDLWQFLLNDDTRDTRSDALLSLSSNALETTISTINTPVKVNGGTAWVDQSTSQFAINTNGRATYTGGKDARLPISISSTIAMASGGAKNITVYVAINGSVIAASGATGSVSTTAGRIGTIWQHTFIASTSDFVELFVENNSDTTNIVVTDSVLRVN